MGTLMHDDEFLVDETVVRSLLSAQMPELAAEKLTKVEPWGTANAIWRLGAKLVLRLPRIESLVGQVHLEQTWLPHLAPHLSVPVPEPVAVGEPGAGYPWVWSLHRWLPGEPANLDGMRDPARFARDLARFVAQLQEIAPTGAPPARNRARPLSDFDVATRKAIAGAAHLIDAAAAIEVWERALAAAPHPGPPAWVHGDLDGNCLLHDGVLGGIVDWGSACAGDPAVDQVIWSPLFDDESRDHEMHAGAEVAHRRVSGPKISSGDVGHTALPVANDQVSVFADRPGWRSNRRSAPASTAIR